MIYPSKKIVAPTALYTTVTFNIKKTTCINEQFPSVTTAVAAWCRGLLECTMRPCTPVVSTPGFCRGYLPLSTWPLRPALGAQGGGVVSPDPTP